MSVVGSTSLFVVKLFSEMLGESMLNRFWYQSGVSPNTIDVDDLVQAFLTAVDTVWSDAVSTEWDGVRIICDEVTSESNFVDGPTAIGPGLVTGETLGPNVAMSIRLFRATKATRSGWKRVAGVAESNQANGVITIAQRTLLDLLADAFAEVLTVDTNAVFPVIVRQTYTGTPPVLDPPTDWIFNVISGAVGLDNLTTQNTRKYGR